MKSDIKSESVDQMPKVSIITPCLNSEKTIRRTVESVLHQSYKNIEYIIVDGGSRDKTLEIIKEYQPLSDGRMRWVSEPDKGIYDAMNKGIWMSHGRIIGIINSDDYYVPDAVEKVIEYLEKDNPYQVIYGYGNFVRGRSVILTSVCTHKDLKRGMIPHATCFVTRAVYVKYGLFVRWLRIAADYELMMRLVAANEVQFTQIKSVLAYFSIGGVSTQKRNKRKAELENTYIKYKYHYYTLREALAKLLDIYWMD